MGADQQLIDSATFRQVMGSFATGVTAVCSRAADGTPLGLAANSFASVSLDPPLVSFCIASGSSTWTSMQESDGFAVSILGADQEVLCRQLSRKGVDRFDGVEWEEAPSGAPVITGALGWVDCRWWARYPGGDHEIVVGEVRSMGLGPPDAAPLMFFRSGFLVR